MGERRATTTPYLTPLGTALRGGNPNGIPIRRESLLPLPLSHDHGLLLAKSRDLILESDHLLLERRDLGIALAQERLRLLVGYRHDGPVARLARPAPVEGRSEAADAGVLKHVHDNIFDCSRGGGVIENREGRANGPER